MIGSIRKTVMVSLIGFFIVVGSYVDSNAYIIHKHPLFIVIDQLEPLDENNAMTMRLMSSILDESYPILTSAHLLHKIVYAGLHPESTLYYQVEAVDLSKWSIFYSKTSSFVLLIPEKASSTGFNIEQLHKISEEDKTLTALEGFLKTKMEPIIYVTASDFRKFLLIKKNDPQYNANLPYWTVVITGHGEEDKAVCNIEPQDIPDVLSFFNSEVNTDKMVLDTCSVGGKNRNLLQFKKDINNDNVLNALNFILIISATTDAQTTGFNYKSFFEFDYDPKAFEGTYILQALLEIISGDLRSPEQIPQVWLPGGLGFQSLALCGCIKILGNVFVTIHEQENKPISTYKHKGIKSTKIQGKSALRYEPFEEEFYSRILLVYPEVVNVSIKTRPEFKQSLNEEQVAAGHLFSFEIPEIYTVPNFLKDYFRSIVDRISPQEYPALSDQVSKAHLLCLHTMLSGFVEKVYTRLSFSLEALLSKQFTILSDLLSKEFKASVEAFAEARKETIERQMKSIDERAIEKKEKNVHVLTQKAKENITIKKEDLKKYFDALGVQENAGRSDVQKAFRKLALRLHPDRGGDKEAFLHVAQIKDLLIAVQDFNAGKADTTQLQLLSDKALWPVVNVEEPAAKVEQDVFDQCKKVIELTRIQALHTVKAALSKSLTLQETQKLFDKLVGSIQRTYNALGKLTVKYNLPDTIFVFPKDLIDAERKQIFSAHNIDQLEEKYWEDVAYQYSYPKFISMLSGMVTHYLSAVDVEHMFNEENLHFLGVFSFMRDAFLEVAGRSSQKTFLIETLTGMNDISPIFEAIRIITDTKKPYLLEKELAAKIGSEITLKNVIITTQGGTRYKRSSKAGEEDEVKFSVSFIYENTAWKIIYDSSTVPQLQTLWRSIENISVASQKKAFAALKAPLWERYEKGEQLLIADVLKKAEQIRKKIQEKKEKGFRIPEETTVMKKRPVYQLSAQDLALSKERGAINTTVNKLLRISRIDEASKFIDELMAELMNLTAEQRKGLPEKIATIITNSKAMTTKKQTMIRDVLLEKQKKEESPEISQFAAVLQSYLDTQAVLSSQSTNVVRKINYVFEKNYAILKEFEDTMSENLRKLEALMEKELTVGAQLKFCESVYEEMEATGTSQESKEKLSKLLQIMFTYLITEHAKGNQWNNVYTLFLTILNHALQDESIDVVQNVLLDSVSKDLLNVWMNLIKRPIDKKLIPFVLVSLGYLKQANVINAADLIKELQQFLNAMREKNPEITVAFKEYESVL